MDTKLLTLTLWVPTWANWVGQSRNGDWLIFDDKPTPTRGEWRAAGRKWEVLANGFEDNPHWRDTLKKI